ncbi:MAG TPA: hypothetical protein VF331_24675 [Polyangiales bacterium]
MRIHPTHGPAARFAAALGGALVVFTVAAAGCAHNEPAKSASAGHTQGGESALSRAGKDVQEAHEHFKAAVKPAASFVDEKAHVVMDEGKKAVNKLTGSDSSDAHETSQPAH